MKKTYLNLFSNISILELCWILFATLRLNEILNQNCLHRNLTNNNVFCIILKDSSETQSPPIKPEAPKTTNGNQYHLKQ